MRFLADYVMRGRLQAVSVTGLCAVLSMLWIPLTWPVGYLSGGAVGLVTLVHGAREGLLNAFGAALLVGLVTGLALGDASLAVLFSLTVWLPVWLVAIALRATVWFAGGLLAATGLCALAVLATYLVIAEPAAQWQSLFMDVVLPAMREAGMSLQAGAELEQQVARISRLMTGMTAAFVLLGVILSLLVARWWQSVLFHPGGFREEFQHLRLGARTGWAAVAIAVLALVTTGQVSESASNLFPLMVVLFLFQGLALAHGVIAQVGAHSGWLFGLYVLLLVLPQTLLLLSAAGFVDNWFDFRARLRRGQG